MSLPLILSLVTGVSAIIVVFVAYCTWRYWKMKKMTSSKEYSPGSNASPAYWPTVSNPFTFPPWSSSSTPQHVRDAANLNVQISQSSPDLRGREVPASPEITHHEQQIGKAHYKTVIKQSTMPTMSPRHLTFQRQLSHRLDLSNVEFTIHSVKYKEQPQTGRLRPELYRQDAQETTASGSLGEFAKTCGRLHFSLRYCQTTECLIVRVIRAEELPPKDFSGTSDPYVKMYLLPDRKNKCQTKVHRKTLQPEFNEEFLFAVSFNDLSERVLQFSMYDFDRFSRHDLIGVVLVRELARDNRLNQEVPYIRDIIGVQHVSACGTYSVCTCATLHIVSIYTMLLINYTERSSHRKCMFYILRSQLEISMP